MASALKFIRFHEVDFQGDAPRGPPPLDPRAWGTRPWGTVGAFWLIFDNSLDFLKIVILERIYCFEKHR